MLSRQGKSRHEAIGPHAAAISIRKLSKHYGGLRALHNVTCDIPQRKITGLIGPNGAGKTTLLNAICGVDHADAGVVELFGMDITSAAPHRICVAGMARTFQNIRVFGDMTASENVLVAASVRYRNRDEIRLAVREALSFVSLGDKANERADSLTHGDRRLLELARAIVTQPKVILLDEPAAGMTAEEVEELLSMLARLRQAGLSIVLIEHNMHVVRSVADEVLVLNEGGLLAQGDVATVAMNADVQAAYLGGSVDQ